MRRHWPLALVLTAFAGAAFLIPTLAPVAVNDDFLYARSVEILVRDHDVRVLPAAAMTLVFQIGWGGLFASVFGDSLGVLRAATVTFSGIGGVAMYALCRELKVSPARSALGAAVFLFNPISLALSYTFMTDTYLLTLVTLAVWCHVRGLRTGEPDVGWTIAGSVLTGCAFLVRQPGILVAVGVLTFLVLARRLRFDRRSLAVVARVALAPVLMAVGWLLWYRLVHGVPEHAFQSGQSTSVREIREAGMRGTLALARKDAVLTVVYLGLFVLPIVVGLVAALPRMVRSLDRRRRLVLLAGGVLPVVASIGAFGLFTGHRPWAPQFFDRQGVGPTDLRGGRPNVLSPTAVDVLVLVAFVAALVLLVVLLQRGRFEAEPRLGLLLVVAAWLAAAVVAQSMPLRLDHYAYDRYFLPLLPLAVAALLAATRSVRLLAPVAWSAVAAMAAFSVAATHDHLELQRATWRVAAGARAQGLSIHDVDGGAAWDGYHLYESDLEHHPLVNLRLLKELKVTPALRLGEHDVSPWWVGYYAPSVTSRFVVAGDRLYGYRVVRRLEYPSWLHADPQYVYLLRAR
jgi:4-amino-4-deoxy-L-arabinose transferase-like glycosyltransferase